LTIRIAVISDTHMPRGNRALPPQCVELIRSADLLIHAGDFSDLATVEMLRKLGPPLTAVHGNADQADVRAALPQTAELKAENALIAVIHDAGPAAGRLARMRRRFPQADAVVFGHSHRPLLETENAFTIFNPGSPTERRREPRHTMGLATVTDGAIAFELVEL
jgi:putative phosphoesterase